MHLRIRRLQIILLLFSTLSVWAQPSVQPPAETETNEVLPRTPIGEEMSETSEADLSTPESAIEDAPTSPDISETEIQGEEQKASEAVENSAELQDVEPPGDEVESAASPEEVETETPVQTASDAESEEIVDERAGNKPIQKKLCNCRFDSNVAYLDRRSRFSGFIGFQSGGYSPTNYNPDFASETFADYYGAKSGPLVELVFGFKLNFLLGSIGPHITAGYYSANKAQDGNDSFATLTAIPVTFGGILALDALFGEPYLVPYAVAGGYTVFYSEKQEGLSVDGNSPFAPFVALGAMLQLDWIDKEAHKSAYEDFGLENTFLFVEGRTFLSAADAVPDFSTPLQINGGLRIEF